jgi:predicted aconitase with swiveling domain
MPHICAVADGLALCIVPLKYVACAVLIHADANGHAPSVCVVLLEMTSLVSVMCILARKGNFNTGCSTELKIPVLALTCRASIHRQ